MMRAKFQNWVSLIIEKAKAGNYRVSMWELFEFVFDAICALGDFACWPRFFASLLLGVAGVGLILCFMKDTRLCHLFCFMTVVFAVVIGVSWECRSR
jgi:hypothetical protein